MDKGIKYLESRTELQQLFKVIEKDEHNRHQLRNIAIFRLAEYCALRISEVGLINVYDYHPDQCTIYCKRLKNSNNNTLRIIDRKVLEALGDYLKIRASGNSNALFLSQRGTAISSKQLDKLMRSYGAKAQLPEDKRHFHVLKHTRAVELGDAGIGIKDIQWWLGHKNINNTLIYMQFTTRQQDALYRYLQQWEEDTYVKYTQA